MFGEPRGRIMPGQFSFLLQQIDHVKKEKTKNKSSRESDFSKYDILMNK